MTDEQKKVSIEFYDTLQPEIEKFIKKHSKLISGWRVVKNGDSLMILPIIDCT